MISQKKQGYSPLAVLKYTGAFMAWVIGSGFATGQEILQFFSSYGYASYGVVALNLAGFLILGRIIITTGYDHKGAEKFSHFVYFCGNKTGNAVRVADSGNAGVAYVGTYFRRRRYPF